MQNLNRRNCLLGLLLLLSGCTSVPERLSTSTALFRVQGRFQVRHPPPLLTGSVVWTHFATADEWEVYSPLQTWLATLTQNQQGATIHLANGQTDHAADARSLSQRWLGIALPLAGMPWWLQGIPMPQQPFTTRPTGFFQEEWEIQITAWFSQPQRLPRDITLTHPATTVRCLLSDWEFFHP